VLAPQKAPKLLTPTPVKIELLAASGVDRLLVLPFTRDFSLWDPEKFVEEVLVKALRTVAVVVGDNFRFGYRAAGDVAMLADLGKRWGFESQILPTIHIRRMPVSSSQIRSLLDEGDMRRANRLLGRPFSIRHLVEPGLGIGRTKTVPTLNLAPYPEFLPAAGVYVTQTRIVESRVGVGPKARREAEGGAAEETTLLESALALRSVTNVGYRPTFGERSLGVETDLLDPCDTLTDSPPVLIEVSFLYRLRDERKFDSADQLKSQIMRDIRRAEAYFRRLRRFQSTPSA
jgi:riboflavin kinase/FMN adenylyltransferase